MHNILLSLVMMPLSIGWIQPVEPVIAQTVRPVVITERTESELILDSIETASTRFNVNKDVLYSILKCESGLKPDKKGDLKNGEYLANGIAQYHRGTFKDNSKLYGEVLDYNSWSDQVMLSAFDLSEGRGEIWTVYRAIKNGGIYSFHSKLLDKDFTVYCKLQKFPV